MSTPLLRSSVFGEARLFVDQREPGQDRVQVVTPLHILTAGSYEVEYEPRPHDSPFVRQELSLLPQAYLLLDVSLDASPFDQVIDAVHLAVTIGIYRAEVREVEARVRADVDDRCREEELGQEHVGRRTHDVIGDD